MIKISSELFVLVEGNDDERLLKMVLRKCFKIVPQFYKYASMKDNKVKKFIHNLNHNNLPYLVFADIDKFPSACDSRASKIQKFGAKQENIVIVTSEIESWYAAGAEPKNFDPQDYKSEKINKELFELLMNTEYRIVSLRKIISCFNTVKARRKSKSFNYFYQKAKNLEIGNKK